MAQKSENDALVTNRDAPANFEREADPPAHKERFFELLSPATGRQAVVLGLIGAAIFFGVWEIGHYATPEEGRRFLPSVQQVVGRLYYLFAEKDFIYDVLQSCLRIFGSFFFASLVAVPLGIALGCLGKFKALVNPTVSGWRYLPAARGLDWPIADVELTQKGAIMLSFDQNLGAFGIGDGKAVCQSLPEEAPTPPEESSGWGELLFGGAPDCETGYLSATWDVFGSVYAEAEVIEDPASAADGLDPTVLEALNADGLGSEYSSNAWIGRVSD